MAREKSKAKLRKLNFVNRDRRIEPMKITDKYLLETIERLKHENIHRFTRGTQRPQHI
jgi:hypothetical protein